MLSEAGSGGPSFLSHGWICFFSSFPMYLFHSILADAHFWELLLGLQQTLFSPAGSCLHLLPRERVQARWLSVHWGLCSEPVFLGEADVQFLTYSGLRNDPLVGLVPRGVFTPKEIVA